MYQSEASELCQHLEPARPEKSDGNLVFPLSGLAAFLPPHRKSAALCQGGSADGKNFCVMLKVEPTN